MRNKNLNKLLVAAAIFLSACEVEVRVPTVYVVDAVEDTTEDVDAGSYDASDTAGHCDADAECSEVW